MAATPAPAPAPAPATPRASPSLISREVIGIYNELVESGRWSTYKTSTDPSGFFNSLKEIRELLTGETKNISIKDDLVIDSDKFKPLTDLVFSLTTSTAFSRKTLKRNSSRKSTFKHSKKH
jgi:hypothetical protein